VGNLIRFLGNFRSSFSSVWLELDCAKKGRHFRLIGATGRKYEGGGEGGGDCGDGVCVGLTSRLRATEDGSDEEETIR
jgi:hypothetical protein